jgi:hypothetical protein
MATYDLPRNPTQVETSPRRHGRRDFLTIGAAVAAVVAGIKMPPAGAVVSDPMPALVDQYFRLIDVVNTANDRDTADRAFEQEEAISQQVVDTVAPSAAGILAQIRMLRDIIDTSSGWADDRDVRLLDSIEAGVSHLGGAA